MTRRGCGAYLGPGKLCGHGLPLCGPCFQQQVPDAIELDAYGELTPLEGAICNELSLWAPRLAGMGNAHVRMDANARHLVAKIAAAVMREFPHG